MKRIQRGPVRGISLKLQEEEREKRMDFVPEVSAIYQETIEVDEDTLQMIKAAGFDKISNVQVSVFRTPRAARMSVPLRVLDPYHPSGRQPAAVPEEGYGETGRLPAFAGGRQQVHVPFAGPGSPDLGWQLQPVRVRPPPIDRWAAPRLLLNLRQEPSARPLCYGAMASCDRIIGPVALSSAPGGAFLGGPSR